MINQIESKNVVEFFAKKPITFSQAIRLARENNITLEFTPKAVAATKHRVSECVKYTHCKTHDEATILAIECCLEQYNLLIRAH